MWFLALVFFPILFVAGVAAAIRLGKLIFRALDSVCNKLEDKFL